MSNDGLVEVKRIVKPAVKRIPHRNGVRMDFAPRRRSAESFEEITEEITVAEVLEATPVVAPAPRPVPRPAPVVAPQQHQIARPGYSKQPTSKIQRPVEEEYRPQSRPRPAKSPFLTSVSVEKRPLSSAGSARPEYTKRLPNIYPEKVTEEDLGPAPTGKKPKKTIPKTEVVLPEHKKQKQSKLTMVILTIATVVVGIALGALAYFAIFKQQ